MRRGTRVFAAAIVAAATALGTLALAQTRGRPPPRPARPAPKVDAQAPAPVSNDDDAGAKSAPVAEPPADIGDGGVKPSPLNPTAQEMPSANGDAGAVVDYDRLLADIAALRARVAAVSDTLYQSRVAIALQTDGDHGKIARLAVSLDDGVVYTAPAAFSSGDATTVYEHAVAPGRHAITVDLDRKDDREESFRTSQRNRFTIDVPRDHRIEVTVKVIDDSSMAADFPGDRSGAYDLRVKVRAVAKPVGK